MARAMWSFAVIDMGRGRVDEAYGRLLACQAELTDSMTASTTR